MASLYETDLNMKMEDVESTIIRAQADVLPFSAMLSAPRDTVAKRFTWPGMLNANPTVAAYPGGFVQTAFANQQPIPMYGFCQEIREGWGIDRQAEAAGTYTRHNDPVWQKKEALKRLMRQKERLFCSRQEQRDQTAGGGAGTVPTSGSMLRGAIVALTPYSASGDPQTVDAFNSDLRTLSAAYFTDALDTFDEDAMSTILNAISAAQGEPVDLMMLAGINLKAAMSKWVKKDLQASGTFAVSTRRNGEQFDYNAVVDVFKFEGGVVRSALSYQLAYNLSTGLATDYTPNSGLLIEKNSFAERKHFGLEHKELADEGQGRSGFYRMMVGLEARMPRRCGLIYTDSAATPAPPAEG